MTKSLASICLERTTDPFHWFWSSSRHDKKYHQHLVRTWNRGESSMEQSTNQNYFTHQQLTQEIRKELWTISKVLMASLASGKTGVHDSASDRNLAHTVYHPYESFKAKTTASQKMHKNPSQICHETSSWFLRCLVKIFCRLKTLKLNFLENWSINFVILSKKKNYTKVNVLRCSKASNNVLKQRNKSTSKCLQENKKSLQCKLNSAKKSGPKILYSDWKDSLPVITNPWWQFLLPSEEQPFIAFFL